MGLCSRLAQSSRGKNFRSGLPFLVLILSLILLPHEYREARCVKPGVTWALWERDWDIHHLTPTTWDLPETSVPPAWLNHFWAVVLPVTQKYLPMRPDNKNVLFGNKCCGSLSAFRIWMKSSSTAGLGNELLQDARSNQVPVNSPSISSMCHFMNLQYFAYINISFYYWDKISLCREACPCLLILLPSPLKDYFMSSLSVLSVNAGQWGLESCRCSDFSDNLHLPFSNNSFIED